MFAHGALHDIRRLKLRVLNPDRFERYQNRRTAPRGDSPSYDCFDRTRSIFVHIPKTGGVSIAFSLYGNQAGSHTAVHEYQMVFSAADFQSYFKFTFVRNPWDRLYSAYRFLTTGGRCDLDRRWSEQYLADVKDFESFVLDLLPRPEIQRWVHLRPQFLFLRNSITRDIGVNFVGRFERLEEDFAKVANRLGKDVTLSHMNRSQIQGDYRTAYSPRMRAVVETIYAADVKIFGYQF